MSIRFAPGTCDPAVARVFIYIDVDQKVTTGVRDESNLGVDYWVDISDSRASLSRCQSNSNVCPSIGTLTLTFVTDGCDVTVPLSQLGEDDGKMDFRVKSETVALSDSDFMPDLALAPGRLK